MFRGMKYDENDNEWFVVLNLFFVFDRVLIEYKDDEEVVFVVFILLGFFFLMVVLVIFVFNDNKVVMILFLKKRISLGKGFFIFWNLGKISVFLFELIYGMWNFMWFFFFVSNDSIGIIFIWVYLFIYLFRYKYFWRKRF